MSTPGEEGIVGAADHHSEAHKQEKETHKQAIEKAKEAYKQAEKQAKKAYEEAVEAEKRAQEQRHREHKAQERAEKERREVAKYLRKHPNATGNATHHGGNSSHHWVNDTLGVQEIQYPVGGSLSLEALPQPAQPHSSLSTVGGVAIVAALGFVAFKMVKKYRRRSNYQQIPSETTPLI